MEDKVRIADEIFNLCYHGRGFNHDEVYSMPRYRRLYNLNRLLQEKKAEADASKKNQNEMTPKPKGVSRPAVSRKPS